MICRGISHAADRKLILFVCSFPFPSLVQGKDARGALVFMARTAETAARYEDMCKIMRELVVSSSTAEELSVEERNLLSVAYKNVIGSRRAAWRTLNAGVDEGKFGQLTIRIPITRYNLAFLDRRPAGVTHTSLSAHRCLRFCSIVQTISSSPTASRSVHPAIIRSRRSSFCFVC
jgi:hypothetical protein